MSIFTGVKLWRHYPRVMHRLYRVLGVMQLSLCSACFRYNHKILRDEHPMLVGVGYDGRYHHHAGGIYRILDRVKDVPQGSVQQWFDDVDHGLFHGLCTAIMGAMVAPDLLTEVDAMVDQFHAPEPWAQKYFLSSVLHDFCRGGLGVEEGHDAALEAIFPDLLPETYAHTSPPDKFTNSPLIIGDRLELQRFDDHSMWVDPTVLAAYHRAAGPGCVDIFYRHVRPALFKLFFGEREIWLRHGFEHEDPRYTSPGPDWSLKVFPQQGTYFNVRDAASEHGFSIDLGRGGLSGCIQHGQDWLHVQGIIPVKRFAACGGSVKLTCSSSTRSEFTTFDHMCGVGAVPLSEWVFHYQTPQSNFPEYENPYADCLQPMFENGAHLLPTPIAEAWQYLVDQWKMRMEVMCEYDRGSREGANQPSAV